ncbi:DUF1700 domain-containing protein [Pseudoduganella umbonata]|uniref:DUF1700 domain-containing protein n=1 Tax=Pseudoduganella umbonata TaxID=864828 RepID=A0A4P8HP39_9BURK|nr:DUF1700 domain-containing protein [Pseudoduganella umbonata]MBB3220122.1 putative membrane protein [Pseudoduganella umbonata]QCP10115.1 DUF1700 domain-containing protein [Pseudoduganella umbonata]
MGKQEYLDALGKAMTGLPPETAARTLAYYEQRFIDGLVAGRSEAEIAADLDEPRKIAMTLRANVHLQSFEQRRTPARFGRMLASFAGLAVFNLFMVVPAAVFAALLIAVYTCSFAFYVGGIAVAASGLAGANEMILAGPLHHMVDIDDDGEARGERLQTRVSIGERGIEVRQQRSPGLQQELDEESSRSGRLLDNAEAMADGSVRISVDPEGASRATQTVLGFGLVVGGIALFLLSLVVTRYSAIGLRRYAQMNHSLLRGR